MMQNLRRKEIKLKKFINFLKPATRQKNKNQEVLQNEFLKGD